MAFNKKVYGETKAGVCVFCGNSAIKQNKINLPVCKEHETEDGSPALKCICGEWVDVLVGKYGPYARCYRCGNVNLNKILELNAGVEVSSKKVQGSREDGLFKVQQKTKDLGKVKINSSTESDSAIKTDQNYKKKRELECGIFFD